MSRPGLRASAVEMRLDISKQPFYARIYSKAHGADFARACAVEMHEMHMDMSLAPFHVRIYRKNAGSRMEHPDQAPALTPTVRTLFSVDTVFGEKNLWK